MLNNIKSFGDVKDLDLLAPLNFGKNRGKYLYELDANYLGWLADAGGYNIAYLSELQARAKKLKEKISENTRAGKLSAAQKNKIKELQLYNHQREFLLSEKSGLAAGIGTGKTRAALAWFITRRKDKEEKLLVICPKSVFSTWQKQISEAARWGGGELTSVVATGGGVQKLTAVSLSRDIVITNYETVHSKAVFAAIKDKRFAFIVADEAHRLKNHNQRTARGRQSISGAVCELALSIPHRLAMTGTPQTTGEANWYMPTFFCDGGATFGPTFLTFYNRFFERGRWSYYSGDFKEYLRPEFEAALQKNWYTVKTEDCIDLPEVTYDTRSCELTGDAAAAYKEALRESIVTLADEEISITAKISEILRLRQICAGGINATRFMAQDKLSLLVDTLRDIDERVIIVCQFSDDLRAVRKELDRQQKMVGVLQGSTGAADRERAIREFSRGESDYLILQADTGGEGIDGLQDSCRTIIFYSPIFSWAKREQIIGRVRRNGQKKSQIVIDLLTTIDGAGSIEHDVSELVASRDDSNRGIINRLLARQCAEVSA